MGADLLEWLEDWFCLQYLSLSQYSGREKKDDRHLMRILIVKQILLVSILGNSESSLENKHINSRG